MDKCARCGDERTTVDTNPLLCYRCFNERNNRNTYEGRIHRLYDAWQAVACLPLDILPNKYNIMTELDKAIECLRLQEKTFGELFWDEIKRQDEELLKQLDRQIYNHGLVKEEDIMLEPVPDPLRPDKKIDKGILK